MYIVVQMNHQLLLDDGFSGSSAPESLLPENKL